LKFGLRVYSPHINLSFIRLVRQSPATPWPNADPAVGQWVAKPWRGNLGNGICLQHSPPPSPLFLSLSRTGVAGTQQPEMAGGCRLVFPSIAKGREYERCAAVYCGESGMENSPHQPSIQSFSHPLKRLIRWKTPPKVGCRTIGGGFSHRVKGVDVWFYLAPPLPKHRFCLCLGRGGESGECVS
jgi:hypothetical protein